MTPGEIIIAKLLHPAIITKVKPWLGWNIAFALTPEKITQAKPFVEFALNKYLQQNVDVIANSLIVPFNCKMTATLDPHVYAFKIRVYQKLKFKTKLLFVGSQLFNYPSGPVNSLNNGFVIGHLPEHPTTSHITSATLKPPPN